MRLESRKHEGRSLRIVAHILLVFCTLCALIPFLLLLSSSLTEEDTLLKYGYSLIPRQFSTFAYEYLLSTSGFRVFQAYFVTFLITIIGTSISLLIGPMLAYPMSRKDYKRAKPLTFIVFFTILFNGGLVPSYIMWTQLFGITNTIFAWIFPGLLFNGFYILLYRNYFRTAIHPSLIEAAKIDGAGEYYTYFKIVVPLSLPILATVGLLVSLGYWNDWANGLYYISDTNLYSLQQLLKSIADNIRALSSMGNFAGSGFSVTDLPSSGIRMAMAVIGVLPIMVLYPFFQKAFVAGIALGGVKE